MPSFYTILTAVGQAKLANAIALGQTIEITDLAVGDGNGALPTPDTSRTALVNEVRRAPINLSEVDDQNPNWVVVEQVLPPDVGGWTIREIGVFDIDGDLIGYGNYPETYKPVLAEGSSRTQTIRFVMEVSDTEAVTLKVDPSVVLATREYVDHELTDHEASRAHPAATTSALGFVEKATITEAKEGAAEKFPDAAGVLASFQQFGLGTLSTTAVTDFDALHATGFYKAKNTVAHAPQGWAGGALLQAQRDNGIYGFQIAIDVNNNVFFRANNYDWKSWRFLPFAASQNETYEGTDDEKFVTPKKLKGWATNWVKAAKESVAGMLKVATQSQVDIGEDDTTAVTPKKLRWGVDFSLGTNGYLVLPSWIGGLIIQWGTSGTSSGESNEIVNFPIAFPNSCFHVSTTDHGADFNIQTIRSFNNTGFTAGKQNGITDMYQWLSIGH